MELRCFTGMLRKDGCKALTLHPPSPIASPMWLKLEWFARIRTKITTVNIWGDMLLNLYHKKYLLYTSKFAGYYRKMFYLSVINHLLVWLFISREMNKLSILACVKVSAESQKLMTRDQRWLFFFVPQYYRPKRPLYDQVLGKTEDNGDPGAWDWKFSELGGRDRRVHVYSHAHSWHVWCQQGNQGESWYEASCLSLETSSNHPIHWSIKPKSILF